jgi:hypothetical protein
MQGGNCMKKLICLTLLLCLLASPALAEPLRLGETLKEGDFSLTLRSAGVTDEWNNETSQTHAWIVLDVTAQTFDTKPVDLNGALSATLTYQGKYGYDAALEFEPTELEPLVALPGKLVFRVPLLVAQADPSELEFVLVYAGTKHPVSLRYAPATGGDLTSVFFDQPEDAILYFVDCVAKGDFMGALGTSAASSMAEAFQFAANTQRINAITPASLMSLPSDYPGYVALNRMGELDQMRRELLGLIQSLLIDPGMPDGMPRALKDGLFEVTENRTMSHEEYIALLDPARLKGLSIQAIYCLDGYQDHSESYQKYLQKVGAVYGYATSKDFLMVYALDSQLYWHACTLAQFEKGWQITYLHSNLVGTSSLGGASFVTEEEIQAMEASGDYVKVYPKA